MCMYPFEDDDSAVVVSLLLPLNECVWEGFVFGPFNVLYCLTLISLCKLNLARNLSCS